MRCYECGHEPIRYRLRYLLRWPARRTWRRRRGGNDLKYLYGPIKITGAAVQPTSAAPAAFVDLLQRELASVGRDVRIESLKPHQKTPANEGV